MAAQNSTNDPEEGLRLLRDRRKRHLRELVRMTQEYPGATVMVPADLVDYADDEPAVAELVRDGRLRLEPV
jgi:hypothetical protein